MPSFRYIATDPDGNRVSGECSAGSLEDAAAQLEVSGFHPLSLEPVLSQTAFSESDSVKGGSARLKQFSVSDLQQVTERIGEMAQAGLPLITGLRALSEEITNSRLKHTLRDFSKRLESGDPLDQVLNAHGRNVPEHLNGLILAGLQTNQLGVMIERYVAYAQESNELRRRVWLSLAYPLVLIFATAGFTFAFAYFVVPLFRPLFEGFDMELPTSTVFLFDLCDFIANTGIYLFPVAIGLVVVAWIVFGLLTGSAGRRRFVTMVPIIGPLF